MVLADNQPAKDEDPNHVVDYRGNPSDKSKTGSWLGAGLIIGTELSERICVMGIGVNMVTYLTGNMHLPSAESANIVTNFLGTLNLLGLVGGFVADAKLGRYLTVVISSLVAALGVILLTLTTTLPGTRPPPCDGNQQCIKADGYQLGVLYVALYTIAIGGGGIKSNVSGFGSDQFDINNPKEEKAMIFFFNRFYFAISIGSVFAVTVLVYIQDNVGRGYGYGISAGTMVVAVTVLLCGTPWYRFKRPQGSPLTVIWKVVYSAWKKRGLAHPAQPSMLNEYNSATVPHTEKLRGLDKAAIVEDPTTATGSDTNSKTALTVTQVEEVKMVLMLIPVWSTCILFWTVYSQMNTFTIEQAALMNKYIGSFEVPAGSFAFFLFFTILVFTSLNDRVFVPIARKFTHTPQGITALQRIGVGLVFATLGMVAAGLVEKKRRQRFVNGDERIAAFWLVPQLFLVGAGEAFAYVGQLEFFIREAPEKMKSMSTGLFLSSVSMGFFWSSLLVSLIDKVTHGKWLGNDMNKGKLDYFYWMLGVLGVVNYIFFLLFAMRHQYKVHNYAVSGKVGDPEEPRTSHLDDDMIVVDIAMQERDF